MLLDFIQQPSFFFVGSCLIDLSVVWEERWDPVKHLSKDQFPSKSLVHNSGDNSCGTVGVVQNLSPACQAPEARGLVRVSAGLISWIAAQVNNSW